MKYEKALAWIGDKKPFLNIGAIERQFGMPQTILFKAMKGQQNLAANFHPGVISFVEKIRICNFDDVDSIIFHLQLYKPYLSMSRIEKTTGIPAGELWRVVAGNKELPERYHKQLITGIKSIFKN